MTVNNDDNGWTAEADAELWRWIAEQLRVVDESIGAANGATTRKTQRLAAARGSAAIAHARELAWFVVSDTMRRDARKAIDKSAHALRLARGV
jgi:hypothetical protein